MGIYPRITISEKRRNEDGSESWVEEEHTPGLIRKRAVMADPWMEAERTDCFCCSCSEFGIDVFCRNHGFAGQRPCEVHNMPGEADDEGKMPASVQKERARNEKV